MTDSKNTKLISPFALHAAQRAEDLRLQEAGFFTPDIYFHDNPEGLWLANNLRRYILKRGYQAEIALDPVKIQGRRLPYQHLKVGKIPELFLQEIKDFMAIEEITTKKLRYCVRMIDNGIPKPNAETAMMQAFKALKTKLGPNN